MAALASATEAAQRGSRLDAATRTELDAWASDDQRPPYAGIPIANVPNRIAPTVVPVRDFGHIGTLATTGGHDTAATYAILYGPDDTVECWLRAGEALSAVWLAATERGIALLPLSVPSNIRVPEASSDVSSAATVTLPSRSGSAGPT